MSTCVVVTGAAGELGRRTLGAALADPSVDRVIATTRRGRLDPAASKCLLLDGLDLTHEEGCLRLREAVDGCGAERIGLVHCAGHFPTAAPLHKLRLEAVADIFAANLLTFLGAAKAVLPAMRRRGRGGIVAFTSHTQAAAYPFLGPFNLSKAALLSAVQTLANENARHAIAINAIAVATLQTETERQIKPDGSYADWVPAEAVASYAIGLVLSDPSTVTGNEIQFWRHSDSFFGKSVFERNSLNPAILDSNDD